MKNLLLLACCLLGTIAHGQSWQDQAYIEVWLKAKPGKYMAYIDYGVAVEGNMFGTVMKDEEGKELYFATHMALFNYLHSKGFEIVPIRPGPLTSEVQQSWIWRKKAK